MAIGMTYEQYWYGDPLMVRAFYKADRIRQQRINYEAWLNGAYVYRALDATVGNMFRQKGSRPTEYPQKPIQSGVETDEPLDKEERNRQEAVRSRAYMMNMVRVGKNWGKKK